ncbi:hypothetical protein EGR_02481 [Echinococcus granulosus]|uniref:Uncharacterized protein n=1 Tax=Echinococcus granulosus TaxID=6210 RepID=W6UMB9_ECHGR|nr:hypothetical protein EGR_02481 [Echinococcus granulosus]EUB62685.1 hypothetical protein EGR_02481 [Echinococcus granulosus]
METPHENSCTKWQYNTSQRFNHFNTENGNDKTGHTSCTRYRTPHIITGEGETDGRTDDWVMQVLEASNAFTRRSTRPLSQPSPTFLLPLLSLDNVASPNASLISYARRRASERGYLPGCAELELQPTLNPSSCTDPRAVTPRRAVDGAGRVDDAESPHELRDPYPVSPNCLHVKCAAPTT